MLLIHDGETFVGAVWYHTSDHIYPGSWMMHMAVAEAYRGRWLSLQTIGEGLSYPFDAGATRLCAHVRSDAVKKLAAKMGFHFEQHETEGLIAYKDRDEWQTT